MNFVAPEMDYAALSPVIALTVGLVVVVLSSVFDGAKRAVGLLTTLTFLTALGLVIWQFGTEKSLVADSLRMDGLDPGFNDAARRRAIVMHGAWYADPDLIRARGRLGRSQGCPALREGIARVVIDAMKQRQLLFAYADDAAWLQRGRSFACDGRDARTILAAARGDAAQGGGAIGAISAP